jgi:hypothetical protein
MFSPCCSTCSNRKGTQGGNSAETERKEIIYL